MTLTKFSIRIRAVGLATCCGAFAFCLACSPTDSPSADTPTTGARPDEVTEQRDYARIQRERAERMDAVAEQFRQEQGDRLFTTAEQVIGRYLEVVGGRVAFDTINTMVLRLSGHGPMGRLTEIVRYYKRPLHYRQQTAGSAIASVTDGWIVLVLLPRTPTG